MSGNVADRIKQLILQRLDLSAPAGFDESTPLFKGGLGMDSFAVVDLITSIESEFKIEFDVTDIRPEHFNDVSALARLVERYLAAS